MTIYKYKYILKNGNLIHFKNTKCKKFSYDDEILITDGYCYMWNYCHIYISGRKCFLLSLYELNEKQLIRATLDIKKHFKHMYDDIILPLTKIIMSKKIN